ARRYSFCLTDSFMLFNIYDYTKTQQLSAKRFHRGYTNGFNADFDYAIFLFSRFSATFGSFILWLDDDFRNCFYLTNSVPESLRFARHSGIYSRNLTIYQSDNYFYFSNYLFQRNGKSFTNSFLFINFACRSII